MLLIICVFMQWPSDNPEGKYFCPAPGVQYYRAESLHTYNVLRYELDINLPMTSRSLSGTNKIISRSEVDGLNYLIMHSRTLTIDSIKVDGLSATFATAGESLMINLPQTYDTGDRFEILVGYHGSWSVTTYQEGFVYYPRNYNPNVKNSIAYTLSQPWDARAWMPCFDENFDKADSGCVIAVTLPDTFVVCANGELLAKQKNRDATTTYVWVEKYPISTYLMHFGASRYAQWSNWYYSAADTVECRYFVWPEDSAASASAYQYVPLAMGLYDSLYGGFPFDRYGHDEVYNGSGFGMEHQENTTLTTASVGGSTQWENIIAHELSHQWWGDMVTCVDNRDIWLNEGFAMFSDANYNWYKWGYSNFLSTMQSRANSYFQADASNRRPLYDPPVSQIFNYGYTYCKANWVVHMLRYLDEANFFPALAVYRDSFEYGVVCTDDLDRVVSTVYGQDLAWFFDEWVYGQGHPEYDIYWSCGPSGGDYRVWLNIIQTQTNAPPVFHMPVEILLQTTGDDTLVRIPITTSPQYVEYTVGDSVTSIVFDPDYWLLKEYHIYYGIDELAADNPGYNAINLVMNPSRAPQIQYVINQTCEVEIDVYDEAGRVVKVLRYGKKSPGTYTGDLVGLEAGVYFCRLKTPFNGMVKKLVVVK